MKFSYSNRFRRAGVSLLGGAGFLLFTGGLSLSAQDNALAGESHRAKELMGSGRYEDAIPIYRQLVKALPGNVGLILNLGLAEEMAGHPDQAIPEFEAVLKAQPDNIPALTSLAMAHLQLTQPGPAIAPLRRLGAIQPANRNIRGMLAGALLATDHPEEAAVHYRKLAAADATDAKAWYGLGSAYEGMARAAFDRLTKLDVKSPYWTDLVAETRLQRGQYRSAFFFYRHAEEGMPNLRRLHSGLALVYRKTGHADWAASEDKREAELASKSCLAKTAECYFASGRFLEAAQFEATRPDALFWQIKSYNALAIEAFSHLGALPESPELHSIKAEIFKGHEQYKESADEVRLAMKLAPGDPRLAQELLTTLFLAHDYNAVVPMLREALKSNPDSADLNFMLGDCLLRTEHPDDAVPSLEAALRANSSMLPAHASLGAALSQLGKASEAIPHLERSLEIDEDGSLHYQLARAYQSIGNAARSRELMSQYQQITAKNQSAKDEVAKEAEITSPSQ